MSIKITSEMIRQIRCQPETYGGFVYNGRVVHLWTSDQPKTTLCLQRHGPYRETGWSTRDRMCLGCWRRFQNEMRKTNANARRAIAMKTRFSEQLEEACRVYHDHGLLPGQYTWDQLLAKSDGRLPKWRDKMQAVFKGLVALNECPGVTCQSQIRELSNHTWHCPACDEHLTSGLLCPICGTRYHIKTILTEPEQAT